MIKKLDIRFIKLELQKVKNLFLAGEFEKVIQKTKVLLKKDPTQIPFYNYIGLAYKQLDKYEMSEETFKSGLKMHATAPSILCNLGALYRTLQRLDEADTIFKKALETHPKNLSVLVNYANLKNDLGKIDEALDLYKRGFEIDNSHETLLINYAGAFQIAGKFEESKKILKIVHEKFPQNIVAHKMYSSANTYKENDEHQGEMLTKINKEMSSTDKGNLYFALAKSYSDQKNHKTSSEYFIKGNEAMFKTYKNKSFDEHANFFNKIKKDFDNYNFNQQISKKKPRLIFIVGLPRSGTTLTHQIISSHSKVFGAGELSIMRMLFHSNQDRDDLSIKIFDKNINLEEISQNVLKKFKLYDDNKIILDKAPLNFQLIGYIKMLFPDAKIIHCTRNIKDTILSIYKNVFDASTLTWTYNQDYLVKFAELYQDLMKFWHNKIPNHIYDCKYEDLVNNKEIETRNLINFCNLDWEDSCFDHTKNKTGIKTVSLSQARKPVYKSSINLYENYIEYLPFLKNLKD